MSELTSSRIRPPNDHQAFERGCKVLWRHLLDDPLAQLHGRRGQSQFGVDITGRRHGDANQIVGVQCKLKSDGTPLTRTEVEAEVEKALSFEPHLSEFVIATTARDDGGLQRLALDLSKTIKRECNRNISIAVYGWETLESEIRRFPEALNAFDPSHTPHGDRILEAANAIRGDQSFRLEWQSQTTAKLNEIHRSILGNGSVVVEPEESVIDRQINSCVDLLPTDPAKALTVLRSIHASLGGDEPTQTRYRIEANIAACQFELGEDEASAQGFIAAYDLDPANPKAIANKALGLAIEGNWPELKAFAERNLADFPDNAGLAASYVAGSVKDDSIQNPLDILTEEITAAPEVLGAYVQWLMSRGEHGAWWSAAINAHQVNPGNETLREFYACALLDRVLDGKGYMYGRALTEHEQTDVKTAITLLESRWQFIRDEKNHVRGDPVSVPHNLMVGYQLLHQEHKVIATGIEAIARFPNGDVALKRHTAMALLSQGNIDEARSLLSGLEVNEQTIMVLFDTAMADEAWDEILEIVNNFLEKFPASERERGQAAKIRAEAELGHSESRRSVLEAGRDLGLHDVRALTVLAEGSRVCGLDDLADEYYRGAMASLGLGADDVVSRVHAANEAMARREFDTASDLLIDHVVLDKDSPELQLLARSLAFQTPVSERAVQFFEQLPVEVKRSPNFQTWEGCLHFNRGAPQEAIKPLHSAFEQLRDVDSLMLLIRAQIGAECEDAVRELLQREDVCALPGSPSSRIDLGHVFSRIGKDENALDIGYQALVEGVQDANVVTRYLTLILKVTARNQISVGRSVQPGNWVQLTPDRGEPYEVLVDEEEDRLWGQKAEASNAFVAHSVGLKVGDSFEVKDAMGQPVTWTVSVAMPRWLRAFHVLQANFSQMFPEARGFASIAMDREDVDRILEYARQYSEGARKQADVYLEDGLPIAFVSDHIPGGSIAFADYLVSINKDLRACSGNHEERAEALELIDHHDRSGAVLDALTAWWAAKLGVFPVLAERVGKLSIPSTELRHFHEIIERNRDLPGEEGATVDFQDGRFVSHVVTQESAKELADYARSLLEEVKKHCEIEPFVVPDNLPKEGKRLLEVCGDLVLAPAILGGSNRLLLCEDMMMRQLASIIFGTKGIWLQAVLLSALEAQTISERQYCEAVVQLAAHHHEYVTIGPDLLLAVFQRDQSNELFQIRALVRYIGNDGADPFSHIKLAAVFINTIWANKPRDNLKEQKATGIVLEAMLFRNRGKDWIRWGAHLFRQLNYGPQKYLEGWCKGHFMPFREITNLLK